MIRVDKEGEPTAYKLSGSPSCYITKSSSIEGLWIGFARERVLLTKVQATELLPILQKFVETGEI